MPTEREPRQQQLEILYIRRLKPGEVANVRWDENGKVYVIEIARQVPSST